MYIYADRIMERKEDERRERVRIKTRKNFTLTE